MIADRTTSLHAAWRRVVWRTLGIAAAGVAAQLPAIVLIAWPLAPFDALSLVAEMTCNAASVGLGVALVSSYTNNARHSGRPSLSGSSC